MRAKAGLRKILIVWAAAYVLALNAIIGSFAGALAYAAAAPTLGTVCHTGEGEPQPDAPQGITECNHCVLCQAPGGGALVPIIAGTIEPVSTDVPFIGGPLETGTQRLLTSVQARAPPSRA